MSAVVFAENLSSSTKTHRLEAAAAASEPGAARRSVARDRFVVNFQSDNYDDGNPLVRDAIAGGLGGRGVE